MDLSELLFTTFQLAMNELLEALDVLLCRRIVLQELLLQAHRAQRQRDHRLDGSST